MKILLSLLMILASSQAMLINPIPDFMEVIHYENYITCSHNQHNPVEVEISRKIKKPESITMDTLEFNADNFKYYLYVDNLNNLSYKTFDRKYHLTVNFYLPDTYSFSELSYHLLNETSNFISDGNINDMECAQPKIVFDYIAGSNYDDYYKKSSDTNLIPNFNFTIISPNETIYNTKTNNNIRTFDLEYDKTTLSIKRKQTSNLETFAETWNYQVTDSNFKLSDIATLILNQEKVNKEVHLQTMPSFPFTKYKTLSLVWSTLFIIGYLMNYCETNVRH